MDIKRRQFLKIAGLSSIAGIGAPAALQMLFKGEFPNSALASSAPSGHAAPAAAPTGKQYGMVIDHRKFVADPGLAQKCIDACHSIHNVPNFPSRKDEIKWIWETPYENAFTSLPNQYASEEVEKSRFLVLCNHCADPPCVRVCPTKATYKNKDGIVLMDFHRCIGCRFCMAACPFGSRSFNWQDPRPFIKKYNPDFPTRMRGVVEKCNFCAERIAKDKEPACVEVCGGNKAIVFGDLNDGHSEIRMILKENFTVQRKPELGTLPSVFYII